MNNSLLCIKVLNGAVPQFYNSSLKIEINLNHPFQTEMVLNKGFCATSIFNNPNIFENCVPCNLHNQSLAVKLSVSSMPCYSYRQFTHGTVMFCVLNEE